MDPEGESVCTKNGGGRDDFTEDLTADVIPLADGKSAEMRI